MYSLKQLNPLDDNYIQKIANIGETCWWQKLDSNKLDKVIAFIDATVPESKSYDQIAACIAILHTRFSHVKDVPITLLSQMGLGVEGNRVYVENSRQFWQHILCVINPPTQLSDLLVVTELAHYPSIREKDWIQVLTDPGTDSNSDDEITLLYLERMRSIPKLDLWPRANYVITAGDAFGDRKKRAMDMLLGVNTPGWSVTVYNPQNETRFYAPYAPPRSEIDPFLADFASACGNYLSSTDCLMIIGQMGTNFSQNLLRFKIRTLVVQGPGFNTMGTDVFALAKIATSFSYTDSAGAARVNTHILCDLLKVASKFSPDIIKYRNMTIWGFLNTDKKCCFERQFNGFKF